MVYLFANNMTDYYKELAEYTNLDVNLVYQLCQSARFHLAKRWHEKKDIDDFYKDTDLYLFDLTMYCDHLQQRGTFDWFRLMVKDKEIKTMVDFGGGIGQYSIIASEEGVKCTHVDFNGPLLNFADSRFKKRNLDIVVRELPEEETEEADLYVCMDVFEHLKDPVPTIQEISKKCKYMMCNPEEPPYSWVYPQHISKFSPEPYFTKIDKYLYQSNQIIKPKMLQKEIAKVFGIQRSTVSSIWTRHRWNYDNI